MPSEIMYGLAAVVVALAIAVGVLFRSMDKWVSRLDKRDDTQQTTIDGQQQKLGTQQDEIAALKQQQAECEAERKADRERLRGIALTCPVTRETCPLQQFFK